MKDFNTVAKQDLLEKTYNLIDTLEEMLKALRITYKTFPECRKDILEAADGIKKEIAEEKESLKEIRSGV